MKHYICSGECGGISKKAGVCETAGCSMQGQDLELCECEDITHNMEEMSLNDEEDNTNETDESINETSDSNY